MVCVVWCRGVNEVMNTKQGDRPNELELREEKGGEGQRSRTRRTRRRRRILPRGSGRGGIDDDISGIAAAPVTFAIYVKCT